MRTLIALLGLCVCYALAAGSITGSNGNIPAPGTSGPLTLIPITFSSASGDLAVGTASNSFKVVNAGTVTVSNPVGSWTRSNTCTTPAYNAVVFIFNSSGGAAGFSRTLTGTSGTFSTFTGTFSGTAGNEYQIKGGPSCFTFKKRGDMTADDTESNTLSFEEASADLTEDQLSKMTENDVLEHFLGHLSEVQANAFLRRYGGDPRKRAPAYFTVTNMGFSAAI